MAAYIALGGKPLKKVFMEAWVRGEGLASQGLSITIDSRKDSLIQRSEILPGS